MLHEGSCHCGAVAFRLEADITEAYDCNCSMCRRRGGPLWFGPASVFTLSTPREAFGTYRFNKHHIDHHFCTTCGIAPFSEGTNPKSGEATVAINVRCLPALDLAGVTLVPVDGASF